MRRERIWGSMSMTHSFIRNSMCWLEHMALDEKTGGDPPGVRLRAAEGLEAVDYFMPGYHVSQALAIFGNSFLL